MVWASSAALRAATIALNDFEAVIAATPWQLRCQHVSSAAQALHACGLQLDGDAPTEDAAVLHQAREWLLVGLRDTSLCVRLACASHLEAAFRYAMHAFLVGR